MLASIRASGGIGGGRLKKVSDQEKRDRSAAAVPGAPAGTSQAGIPKPAASGSSGGLGDALALALSARNKKVSASGMSHYFGKTPLVFIALTTMAIDDEDEDEDDDWDDTPKRRPK